MGKVIRKKIQGLSLSAKLGLIFAFTLISGLFLYDISDSAPTANGRIIYSISTTIPQHRPLAPATGFAAAAATVAGATNQAFMTDRASATRDEHIAGYVTTGGVLYIYRWNGTSWINETAAAGGWGGTVSVGGNGVDGRRFDIAYEKTSGDAMVVYSTGATGTAGNEMAYRKWNGATWTAATNISSTGFNQNATVTWIKLKAKPTSGSNEIALLAADTGTATANTSILTSFIWNGTNAWTEAGTTHTGSAGATLPNTAGQLMQNNCFDHAYESTSGDLLVVFSTTAQQWYRTYSGGTWGNATSYASGRTPPIQMMAEADPQSDRILVMFNRSASVNVYASIWSGTAPGAVTAVGTNGVTTAVNKNHISGQWLVLGGVSYAIPIWTTSTAGTIGYNYYTGAAWGTAATYVTGTGVANNWMDYDVDPLSSDTLMLTFSTGAAGTGSLYGKRLVLTAGPTFTWTNHDGTTTAPVALTGALASATSQNFAFAYNRYVYTPTTTVGTVTATGSTTGSISFSMPFSRDDNNNNTYTVDYKLSSEPTVWTNFVTAAAHTTSPYASTITNLAPGTYDVRMTYNDTDGVTGTNPQTVTSIVVTDNRTAAGTATAVSNSISTIDVSMPFTNDSNNNNTYTIDYKLTSAGTYTNWVTAAAHVTSPYTNTITGLTSGTSYDVRVTYNDADGITGTATQIITLSTLSAKTTVGTASASAAGTNINYSMPYTDDPNSNNTYTVDYKLSSSGTWTNWVTAAAHTTSPYSGTITGLTPGSSYDVRMTYNDADGVNGTNPQIVTGIVLPLPTSAGAMSFPIVTSSAIQVQVAFTGDSNANNSCVIKWGTVSGTYPNTITATRDADHYSATALSLSPLTTYYFQATFADGDGVTGANPVTGSTITLTDYSQNDLLHNSDTINKFGTPTSYVTPYGTAGKWGVPGGTYGAFSCATCHTNVNGATTNIKRIVATVPAGFATIGGRTIAFQNVTGTKAGNNGFGDDAASYTTSAKVCNVCHENTTAHRYNNSVAGVTDKPNHQGAAGHDCTSCHPHNKGFYAFGDCMNCHSVPQGKRRAIINQFTDAGNSHHYQGNDFSTKACYPCHWAANSDGSLNSAYHGGYKSRQAGNSTRVHLVVYTSATRPRGANAATMVEYSSSVLTGTTRTAAQVTQLGILNNHCLGCHGNGRVKNTDVFNDGKTPTAYKLSTTDPTIVSRYGATVGTATGTATWGKVTVANNVLSKAQTKAYNAHNATATNQRAWVTTVDTFATPANAKTRQTVYCFDCHNSHGSSTAATGITTSYSSATGKYKGGILKETVASQGGYNVTYKPAAGGSAANHNVYNAGAALCYDCHMNKNNSAATTGLAGGTPWSYGTFGSYSTIIGYWDTKYFGKAGELFESTQATSGYPYKALGGVRTANMGGHFGKSEYPTGVTMSTTPSKNINNLCTPCHDPHGVSPTMTNAAYAVPLLRGTWATSPYKQDAAPAATNETRGGGSKQTALSIGSTPAYWIDQNTMTASTAGRPATAPKWNFATAASGLQTLTDVQFAGLCTQCHNKSDLNNTATVTSATGSTGSWKSMTRIHNTVEGWATTTGGNLNNTVHAFTCSKCHTAHNSRLPRLLVTNCLDVKHRGRVQSTGSASVPAGTGSNQCGSGAGRFPSGGGGASGRSTATNPGPWFFGDTVGTSNSSTTGSQAPSCHAATTAGGTDTIGDTENGTTNHQWWNSVSPW